MPSSPCPNLKLTYVGGPTVKITVGKTSFLTDPTFDPAGSQYVMPHVTLNKNVGPAVGPQEIGSIDAVLLSHDQHADNLDRSGRVFVQSAPLTLTTVAGAQRLGGSSVGLEPWQSFDLKTVDEGTLRVTATPARHGPVGIEPLAGDVVGFVVTHVETGTDLFYVTGDTCWYEGVEEVSRRFNPSCVFLFAGAAKTRGPFHLTMDTNDALETASAFPNSKIVPLHHEGWEHFTQTEEDLKMAFLALGRIDQIVSPSAGFSIELALVSESR